MKRILKGVDKSGKTMIAVEIDGNKVTVLSRDKNFSVLDFDSMKLRCSKTVGGIVADGFRIVKPGDADYVNAVIDTLEGFELNVVG